MPEHAPFFRRLEALEGLVADGHERNEAEIIEHLSEIGLRRLALRYFIDRATTDERFRRLTSAQSFYVCGNDRFYMRLNAWYPQRRQAERHEQQLNDYFSIDRCHNHATDFFTVGVLGNGYRTIFRETARDLDGLTIGDEIEFSRIWEERLTLGKALYVPKTRYFHTQYHPEDYSLSLNLIVRAPVDCAQYMLNSDCTKISEIYDLRGQDSADRKIDWF